MASRTCSTCPRLRPATARSRSPSRSRRVRTSTRPRCSCRTALRPPSRACPAEVRQIGVTVAKNSPDLLLVATLVSPDGSLPQQYLSNYATLQLLDRLGRIHGVGGARLFGGRDYNMRIWIDPGRAAEGQSHRRRGRRRCRRTECASRCRRRRPTAVQQGRYGLSARHTGQRAPADAGGFPQHHPQDATIRGA